MNVSKGILFSILGIIFSFSIYHNYAYAYLDPGSVSYVTQILIALLIGGLVAIKMFWAKIKIFLSNLFNKKKDDKDDD